MKAIDFGSSPLYSTAEVYISILDVNDNMPVFSTPPNTTFILSYQSVAGQTVGAVFAADVDTLDHGRLLYQLVEGIYLHYYQLRPFL